MVQGANLFMIIFLSLFVLQTIPKVKGHDLGDEKMSETTLPPNKYVLDKLFAKVFYRRNLHA